MLRLQNRCPILTGEYEMKDVKFNQAFHITEDGFQPCRLIIKKRADFMTFLFQKWRLSNLQERIIVAQYLCSYKFPAILKWLSGESEFIDLKLQFSSYIIHRCDERGEIGRA